MPTDYAVLAQVNRREWKGNHGPMVDYTLDVESEKGKGRAVLTQKPETPEPLPGQTIFGDIVPEEIPKRDGTTFTKYKLKKAQRDEGAVPSGPHRLRPSQSIPSGPSGGNADDRSERIERQSALKVVASLAQAVATAGRLPQDFDLSPASIHKYVAPAVDAVVGVISPPSGQVTAAPVEKEPAPPAPVTEEVMDWRTDDEDIPF